jgi:ketosteroid isomerase-like protein
MSQENVELVYRGFDAWTRHDLDEALAGSDPDVEITLGMGPASTTYRGHEGMRTWADDPFSAFPDFSAEVLEARDLGDFLVDTVRIHGQGAASDVSSEQTVWYASQWRDAKPLCYRAFESESEGLKAVGARK